MRKLHRELNLTELTICYGMTETSPVSCMTTTDDPLEKRIDSVGRLLPHVSAKVVDPSDWTKILPVGERGELAVSGYLVMQGYWGDEKKSAEVLVPDEEGVIWMHVSFVTLPSLMIEVYLFLRRLVMKHPWMQKVTSKSPDVSKISS